ncbi:MAG: hypothetical protein LQ342_003321 [Letrouitia transgressa]|nr:MAG: hypothetical protein LQ342_003321 [Letrouitia transgressa]
MRDAYDAIKVALNTTFMKAIKNGLPINPYIAMLFEIPRLRQKASNDNKYDSPDKTAAIIQVAVLQTSKIDLALSDRMKLAEIISGVAFSNFPLQHDGELAQKLDITRSALNDLVVLCDRHKEARGDDIFSTARLNVDALRRAYLVSVESVKQWEPQTPDFMINLFPQESHRGFSLFDSTTTSSKTSTQTSERNTGVPNITVTDTHLSTSSANTTRPRDESAHRNSTATSQSQPAQQPSGGLFGSGSNLFGTSSSGSLFSTPGSTSLFSGGDTSTIPASNTSPFGAATTGASPGRLFATAGSRPTQSRSIFSNLFSSSTTQPSASNNQQTRSSSIFSSGPNLSASASPTPTDPAVIAANQRQTAPQSSTTPAANQHSYRQPFVVDESEDAMDTTPTIATPETSRSSAALQSLTQNVASEASRHEDEDDHWSGLLQRIRDFRAHQQSSGIDDVARRREEHVMTLMGVALDLAESGMA